MRWALRSGIGSAPNWAFQLWMYPREQSAPGSPRASRQTRATASASTSRRLRGVISESVRPASASVVCGVEALQGCQDRILILDRTDVGTGGLRRPADWLIERIGAAKATTGASRTVVLVDSLQTIPTYTDPPGQPW